MSRYAPENGPLKTKGIASLTIERRRRAAIVTVTSAPGSENDFDCGLRAPARSERRRRRARRRAASSELDLRHLARRGVLDLEVLARLEAEDPRDDVVGTVSSALS